MCEPRCETSDLTGMRVLGAGDGILYFVCGRCGDAKPRTFFHPHLTDMSARACEIHNERREHDRLAAAEGKAG